MILRLFDLVVWFSSFDPLDVPSSPSLSPLSDEEDDIDHLDEELSDADRQLKIEIDVHMENVAQDYDAQQEAFRDFRKKVKNFNGFLNLFLAYFEFGSNNKDNLINVIKLFFSKESADWFEKGADFADDLYKLGDNALKLAVLGFQYYHNRNYFTQAVGLDHVCDQYMRSHQNDEGEISVNVDQIEEMQGTIRQFTHTVQKQWAEANKKMLMKIVQVFTRGLPFILKLYEVQNAKKMGRCLKCVGELYKVVVDSIECYTTFRVQKQWFFHLQTCFVVNITPSNPTDAEKELLRKRKRENESLIERASQFLESLEHYETIEEVQLVFDEYSIPCQLPPSIEEFRRRLTNPRFGRELVQHFYCYMGKRAAMKESQVRGALRKREQEFNSKIDLRLNFIMDEVEKCEGMTFDEVQDHFAQLHIDITSITLSSSSESDEDLPLPPTSLAEWEECIHSEEFVRALTGKWIEFHDTSAQMLMQSLRQSMLSKYELERKFLMFDIVRVGVRMVSLVVQLALFSPKIEAPRLDAIMKILSDEIHKLGMPSLGVFYLASPLYPDVKFRIEALFLLVAKHLFAVRYKPNEYSLEGYKLSTQLQIEKFKVMIYSLQYLIQVSMLWINIRLVENCIMRLPKTPFTEDRRYTAISEKDTENKLNSMTQQKDLEDELYDLTLKDARLAVDPTSGTNGTDPFANIANLVLSADVDYFPPHVIEFVENHMGFKLTNETKAQFQEKLEKFFTQGTDILHSHSENAFTYLRA